MIDPIKKFEQLLHQKRSTNDVVLNEDITGFLNKLSDHQDELKIQYDKLRHNAKELEIEKNHYLNLFEDAPIAYVSITPTGDIVSLNNRAKTIFGSLNIDADKKTIFHFIDSKSIDAFRQMLNNVFVQHQNQTGKVHIHTAEKQDVCADLHLSWFHEKKNVQGLCSIAITNQEKVQPDFNIRLHAEQALRESEQRLNMALQGTNAGFWDWDINTGKVIFDKRWVAMLGFDDNDIKSHISWWNNLIHPEDFESAKKTLTDHLKGRTDVYKSVHRLQTKEGGWKFILDSGMVISRSNTGTPLRAVGTHQDVTEHMQTEQKLRELNITKDKLFSIIAHDLKSPYNAQLGFLELLLENENPYTPKQREKFIKTVYHSTRQSFALLDNLLVWSGTQTGKIPFNPAKIHLAQIFEETIYVQKYAAQAKTIIIDTHLTNENIEVTADYEMVNVILRNLLSNAIKFTPDNGRIIIGGKPYSESQTLIFISDTGVGIPNNDIEKLFDPTYNFSTIGTNREKGTGIGLILCKEFVERNGGDIWVESTEGKGSVFYFTLESIKAKKKYM